MSLSQRLNLGLTQPQLDFVDIDDERDTPLFLDPYFIGLRQDRWSFEARRSIRSFFQAFLDLIKAGKEAEAALLFNHLHEPKETGLGLARRRLHGHGVGEGDAERIFESLKSSKAVTTGLVEDLEDCRIFVHGIDKDKTSDMTTNIIRGQLTKYTQDQCRLHGIPMVQAPSGFIWDITRKVWSAEMVASLLVGGRKLLLVPMACFQNEKG